MAPRRLLISWREVPLWHITSIPGLPGIAAIEG